MTNLIEIKKAYKILGLDLGASKEDAKKAHRKLALNFHPDKNPMPDASEIFQTIQEAYECIQRATDEEIVLPSVF